MPLPFSFPENSKLVTAVPPTTNGSLITGDYVSLKNAGKCFVVCNITVGTTTAVVLTIEKATAVAGTGTTAITTSVPIWVNADCGATDTLVRQSDGVGFSTAAAVKQVLVVFEIKPESLGDFDCITVKAASGSASNIVSATYHLVGLRYSQATPPAAITD
jgi:hypothetical protein